MTVIDNLSAAGIGLFIIALLLSMTVHEATHAYAGYLLGDNTARESGRLSFNPLRHIDPFLTVVLPIVTIILFRTPFLAAKPVPYDPERVKFGDWGAAIIALAGPVSNFVIAFVLALFIRSVTLSPFLLQLVADVIVLNIALFVFNMIPLPPLDGSRVLFALAPESVQEFMIQIEPYGLYIIFGLVLILGNNILPNIYDFFLRLLP